jgi:hypothetical protein
MPPVGIDLLTNVDEQVEVLADAAYGTGDALAALADAEHTPIIKPWPLRSAMACGFTLDDFIVMGRAEVVAWPRSRVQAFALGEDYRAICLGARAVFGGGARRDPGVWRTGPPERRNRWR